MMQVMKGKQTAHPSMACPTAFRASPGIHHGEVSAKPSMECAVASGMVPTRLRTLVMPDDVFDGHRGDGKVGRPQQQLPQPHEGQYQG